MNDRCTGHCCKNFSLPFSPEEIMDKYRQWMVAAGNKPGIIPMSNSDPGHSIWDPDIHIIALMVVYLGPDAKSPKYVNLHEKGSDTHRYKCKHWDAKSKDCTIYEARPQMCRVYPGLGGCNYAACTSKSKREKTKPYKPDKGLLGGDIKKQLEEPT